MGGWEEGGCDLVVPVGECEEGVVGGWEMVRWADIEEDVKREEVVWWAGLVEDTMREEVVW